MCLFEIYYIYLQSSVGTLEGHSDDEMYISHLVNSIFRRDTFEIATSLTLGILATH